VVLDVQRPFRRLVSGLLPNGLAGVAEIVARGEPLPAFRPALPFAQSAAGVRHPASDHPSATPYLRAEAQSLTNWKERLEPARRRRIGLTWSGGPTPRHRSMKLKELLPLLDLEFDATPVSLQKEVHPKTCRY